jgi:hypothetical protein
MSIAIAAMSRSRTASGDNDIAIEVLEFVDEYASDLQALTAAKGPQLVGQSKMAPKG